MSVPNAKPSPTLVHDHTTIIFPPSNYILKSMFPFPHCNMWKLWDVYLFRNYRKNDKKKLLDLSKNVTSFKNI